MRFIHLLCTLCFFSVSLQADSLQAENAEQLRIKLESDLKKDPAFFNYPLNLRIYPANHAESGVLLMLHGYGGDYRIAEVLQNYGGISEHLISFNFPDYGIFERNLKPSNVTLGSLQEILPLIYVLKKLAVDSNIKVLNIYGFSAGAGALVNALVLLNTTKHDAELEKIGVQTSDKKSIIQAIERGWVLLDAPLKSMDEISESNGIYELDFLSKRYIKNEMRPIDSLKKLKGLKLNVIVYFETPDEVISNRDDDLYAERLKQVNNKGKTLILKDKTGGHTHYHSKLWNAYRDVKQ